MLMTQSVGKDKIYTKLDIYKILEFCKLTIHLIIFIDVHGLHLILEIRSDYISDFIDRKY